ncbi:MULTISPECIES: hypothetical protein [unclassified Herbaspirillum]|uniref:hypothetical protein n=1 Tax=unclassified Herbaspirillum TaxID=2624150 RepID=UPI001151AD62|nr:MULTISPECIES: hypothetical protein [unclassified Herbaspirillum]MBB5393676.1 hypothetical protein [Herbaspirillum sp. SJZ102]TQK01462.1 hypothetical protein FB599_3955 [Herbaspirillum sp. SJZ130]TQK05858.1 hypothetical protein FB598_3895 [Herbaspirillum sp. SJZ106]TWC65232.1 hypothetical protein FB597_107179 [Herbaspirillum sp. SJZ099]
MPILRSTRCSAFIALLVVSLLFAQGLGFLHGIAHAGWQGGAVHSLVDEALFDEGDDHRQLSSAAPGDPHASTHGDDPHHSCAAYDAATLSAGMHVDFPLPPLLPPARMLALWQAFASWDAPFVRHFSSRAPPC